MQKVDLVDSEYTWCFGTYLHLVHHHQNLLVDALEPFSVPVVYKTHDGSRDKL